MKPRSTRSNGFPNNIWTKGISWYNFSKCWKSSAVDKNLISLMEMDDSIIQCMSIKIVLTTWDSIFINWKNIHSKLSSNQHVVWTYKTFYICTYNYIQSKLIIPMPYVHVITFIAMLRERNATFLQLSMQLLSSYF